LANISIEIVVHSVSAIRELDSRVKSKGLSHIGVIEVERVRGSKVSRGAISVIVGAEQSSNIRVNNGTDHFIKETSNSREVSVGKLNLRLLSEGGNIGSHLTTDESSSVAELSITSSLVAGVGQTVSDTNTCQVKTSFGLASNHLGSNRGNVMSSITFSENVEGIALEGSVNVEEVLQELDDGLSGLNRVSVFDFSCWGEADTRGLINEEKVVVFVPVDFRSDNFPASVGGVDDSQGADFGKVSEPISASRTSLHPHNNGSRVVEGGRTVSDTASGVENVVDVGTFWFNGNVTSVDVSGVNAAGDFS